MGALPLVLGVSCLRPTAPCTATLKEKRSEFIGALFPAGSAEEARTALDAVRKEHYSATHNCPAWRIGFPETEEFSSDDGEPGGTAGRPILGELQKAGLCNALVVVTRYFGGVKLGVRGLIDAYAATAAAVIAQAQTERTIPLTEVKLRCGYTELSGVRHAVKSAGVPDFRVALDYGADIAMTLRAAPDVLDGLKAALDRYEVRQLLLADPVWAASPVLTAAKDGEI